jgi:nitrogen regulatory protein PII
MEKLDQRIQLVASNEFSKMVDEWRRTQSDLPSRSEAIRRLVQRGLRYEKEHPMHMITAIIRPHKYDEVRAALLELGVEGITVSQVKGFGRQRGQTEIYRGAEYETVEVPKLRLEIAVDQNLLNQVVETVQKISSTGKIGDGKLFVHSLDEVVRIRTGERDQQALR